MKNKLNQFKTKLNNKPSRRKAVFCGFALASMFGVGAIYLSKFYVGNNTLPLKPSVEPRFSSTPTDKEASLALLTIFSTSVTLYVGSFYFGIFLGLVGLGAYTVARKR